MIDLLALIHLHINCLKEENLAKFTDTDSIVGFTGLCLTSKISNVLKCKNNFIGSLFFNK